MFKNVHGYRSEFANVNSSLQIHKQAQTSPGIQNCPQNFLDSSDSMRPDQKLANRQKRKSACATICPWLLYMMVLMTFVSSLSLMVRTQPIQSQSKLMEFYKPGTILGASPK